MSKTTALQCVANNDLCSLRIVCNKACNLELVDNYGNTALLKACYLGRHEAVGILLEFNANIRATNYFGQNALTLATYAGSLRAVRKLLKFRSYADFNLSSITPALCIATMRQHRHLIEYFNNLQRNEMDEEEIVTVHGLTPKDLERFVKLKQTGERYAAAMLL